MHSYVYIGETTYIKFKYRIMWPDGKDINLS